MTKKSKEDLDRWEREVKSVPDVYAPNVLKSQLYQLETQLQCVIPRTQRKGIYLYAQVSVGGKQPYTLKAGQTAR